MLDFIEEFDTHYRHEVGRLLHVRLQRRLAGISEQLSPAIQASVSEVVIGLHTDVINSFRHRLMHDQTHDEAEAINPTPARNARTDIFLDYLDMCLDSDTGTATDIGGLELDNHPWSVPGIDHIPEGSRSGSLGL